MQLSYSFSSKILSSSEMRDLETEYCAINGKTLLDLMEAAGAQVAAFIEDQFSVFKDDQSKILIVSGPGNNGGDGLVAARQLLAAGFKVDIVLLASSKYSSELQDQIQVLREQKIEFFLLLDHASAQPGYIGLDQLKKLLSESALVVDALLGAGQKGSPHGLVLSVLEHLLAEKKIKPSLKVISIDLPTGIDCDCGAVFEPHIQPDFTLVIQYLKLGIVQQPALEELGQIVLLDAGIDSEEISTIGRYSLLGDSASILSIQPRAKSSHKGNFGHILILGGSEEMPGAAAISAIAALRSGAGMVTQLSFGKDPHSLYPELMHIRVEAGLSSDLFQKISGSLDKYSCLVLGPGLGTGQAATSFVFEVLREVQTRNLPCVLDADGLNALAELLKLGVPMHLPSVIMTPHPGEAARILQISSAEVQANRYLAAEKISSLCKTTVLLKGASSICFNGSIGTVNPTGGAFLATAGSGDVLAGMIASFYAAGRSAISAASLGAYLHGIAGELSHQEHGGPIIATDIIGNIPHAMGKHVSSNF